MLRVLHVEDDPSAAARFAKGLVGAGVVVEITVVRSRTDAFLALGKAHQDIIVCDLAIPTVTDGLDLNELHGLAVLSKAQEVCPGTPLLVLSAFGTLPLLSSFLASGLVIDCFGSGLTFRMADEASKDELGKAIRILQEVAGHIDALDLIDINYGVGGRFLTSNQERIVRIYARRMGGDSVSVSLLAGGLSDTITVRCVITGAGTASATVAVRLAPIADIQAEHAQYQTCMPATLEPGAFVPYADMVISGAGLLGGIFYRLADHYSSSLFSFATAHPEGSVASVQQLRTIEEPWGDQRRVTQGTVAELRRSLIDDDTFHEVAKRGPEAAWLAFDELRVRSGRLCQHGDLHPLNVLVDTEGKPILIDFGRLGDAPAAVDPIALELGPIFHPDMRDHLGAWPTLEQATNWVDVENFAAGSPFPGYIRQCREWAFAVAPDKGVYAATWSYAIRQLQFPGANHAAAVEIAESARRAFLAQ